MSKEFKISLAAIVIIFAFVLFLPVIPARQQVFYNCGINPDAACPPKYKTIHKSILGLLIDEKCTWKPEIECSVF